MFVDMNSSEVNTIKKEVKEWSQHFGNQNTKDLDIYEST